MCEVDGRRMFDCLKQGTKAGAPGHAGGAHVGGSGSWAQDEGTAYAHGWIQCGCGDKSHRKIVIIPN